MYPCRQDIINKLALKLISLNAHWSQGKTAWLQECIPYRWTCDYFKEKNKQ